MLICRGVLNVTANAMLRVPCCLWELLCASCGIVLVSLRLMCLCFCIWVTGWLSGCSTRSAVFVDFGLDHWSLSHACFSGLLEREGMCLDAGILPTGGTSTAPEWNLADGESLALHLSGYACRGH
jgi:hypothetical protein